MKAGFINYSNSHPFYAAICQNPIAGIEIDYDIPSNLNQKLYEGKLSCSAVSLFEYLLHEDQYLLLPDWCINSRGYVRSVLLYSKVPFKDLNQKNILLCAESATSNNLCRLLLHHHNVTPKSIELPSEPTSFEDWDALVLIGDPALKFNHPEFKHITDLAEAWVKWTQGPVVFAVQAVRKDQVEDNQGLLKKLLASFADVQKRLKDDLGSICYEVQQAYPAMKTDFMDYFKCLDFQLDQSCLKAIQRYSFESSQIGTLPHPPSLTFAPI